MIRLVSLVVLILLFLLMAVILFYPDYESPRIVRSLIIIVFMFLLSLAIFAEGHNLDFEKEHRTLFFVIVVLALAVRIIVLVGAEDKFYLSDDIYRYVWDGKVSAEGINPYKYAPLDQELEDLRDSSIHPHINFPHMRTIYPPVAQDFFLAAYKIGGGNIIAFKLMFALFEVLTFFLLLKWLFIIGVKRSNLLLYLFSPLILVEFYISAHLDILGIPFLIAALISMEREKPLISGLLMACASLVKFYGLFFVPFMFFHFKKWSRLAFLSGFIVFGAFLYLPYIVGIEFEVLGSLPAYLMEWHYYASVYDVLLNFFETETARYIIWGAFGALFIFLLFIRMNVYQKMFAVFGGYVVLTPALFPWYLVWIYPFILRNLSPAFWYLTGSILLAYNFMISVHDPGPWAGSWSENIYLRLACYIPFYLLLIWSAGKWIRSRIRQA